MTIPRRTEQAGVQIVGSLLRLVFGTAADQPATGDHDHTATGVGSASAATTYRGGQVTPPTLVSGASATGGAGDFLVLFKGTGAQEYTLPNPATHAGRTIAFYEAKGDAGTKTIKRHGGEKINGATADATITSAWGRKTLVSDGTDWVAA